MISKDVFEAFFSKDGKDISKSIIIILNGKMFEITPQEAHEFYKMCEKEMRK